VFAGTTTLSLIVLPLNGGGGQLTAADAGGAMTATVTIVKNIVALNAAIPSTRCMLDLPTPPGTELSPG
jgi:hypothetical protein